MSHPRLPEISQISVLPHHQADSQHCKICKFQKFLESENIVISSENKIVNYVNEKNFLIGQCRQVSPKLDADWKMSVAMKFIQDAKSLASSKS